jgi:hypothetical protein
MNLLFSLSSITWNAAWAADPLDSDSPSQGASEIREVKDAVEERMKNEHTTYTGDGTSGTALIDWNHKEGSAKAYYEATEPTQRPNASTALSAADAGRIWIDSDDGAVYYYSGSAWTEIPYDNLIAANAETITGKWDFQGDLQTDVIDESTAATGVTIDSVLLKDGDVTVTTGNFLKGGARWPVVYQSTTATQNALFDAIDAYIPTTNDVIMVSGGFSADLAANTGESCICSYAKRIDDSNIYFYGIRTAYHLGNSTVGFEGGTTSDYIKVTNGIGDAPVSDDAPVSFARVDIAW